LKTVTRNKLSMWPPIAFAETNLPSAGRFADPSHAAGHSDLVQCWATDCCCPGCGWPSLSRFHPNPDKALEPMASSPWTSLDSDEMMPTLNPILALRSQIGTQARGDLTSHREAVSPDMEGFLQAANSWRCGLGCFFWFRLRGCLPTRAEAPRRRTSWLPARAGFYEPLAALRRRPARGYERTPRAQSCFWFMRARRKPAGSAGFAASADANISFDGQSDSSFAGKGRPAGRSLADLGITLANPLGAQV